MCFAILILAGCASPQQTRQGGAQTFSSPDEAVQALTTAVRVGDVPHFLAIMGPQGEEIASSGDEVADRQRRQKFLALYDEKHVLVKEDEDRLTLVVGKDDWPFPVPIVRDAKRWRFDAEAGLDEILSRRIGENELNTIQVCKAIADAQREYALRDPGADGTRAYARKFLSDPGQRNGLFWPTAEGEAPSPLGALAADAAAEGYKRPENGPAPFHGYYFRMLESQGPNAPDGAVDYVVNGRMTLGFAVVAYPADYGNSGIMTFIMGQDGVVYQKDLGAETAAIAGAMKSLDPGEGWKKVE